jgi:HemY protein
MIRGLWFFFQLTVLVIGAVWLAEQKGPVSVQWHGWLIETTVGMLFFIVLVLAAVFMIAWRVWQGVRGTPNAIGRMRSRRRRSRGYMSLVKAHAAIASGDGATALRHAGEAGAVGEPALTHLVAAEAAMVSGNADRAESEYALLAARPDTALIGLRGQIGLAEQRGDFVRAIELARRACKSAPKSPWAFRRLFELQGKAGFYDDAERTLADASKLGAFPAGAADRLLARILFARARKAEASGMDGAAAADAERANKLDPTSPDYAVLAARMLLKSGKANVAERILTKTWPTAPTPSMAAAWMALAPHGDVTARLKQAERLHALDREIPEGRFALATAQLAAGRWAEARAQLTAIGHSGGARYFQLMAYLDAASGNQETAQAWLEKSLINEPGSLPLALSAPETIHPVV